MRHRLYRGVEFFFVFLRVDRRPEGCENREWMEKGGCWIKGIEKRLHGVWEVVRQAAAARLPGASEFPLPELARGRGRVRAEANTKGVGV